MSPEESASEDRRRSVAALIEAIETAEDPERELINSIIAHTRQRDAELADVIRFCAIPRHFDASIIGVLREAPDQKERNERLLAGVVAFSFVRTWPDGGYAYDDTTREILLAEWRTDGQRAQFEELNRRLVTFYVDKHAEARWAEKDLERVAHVVESASLERYLQLASLIETRMLAPLLEAIYHQTLHSAKDGYELFNRYFEEYEASGRLVVCGSLVNATRDYFERLPADSGQQPWLMWMRYWDARVKRGLGKYEAAEQLLRGVLSESADDAKLRLWAMGDLVDNLHQQFRLREACEESTRLLSLSEETQADLYNHAVWVNSRASLHVSQGEPARAAERYREAIEAARQYSNPSLEIYALLGLSGALSSLGQWEDAIRDAFTALHLVNTRFSQDRALQQAVTSRFMALFAQRDPQLLDTLVAENDALLMPARDSAPELDLRGQYMDLLRMSGQLGRATGVLADLRARVPNHVTTAFGSRLLVLAGLLHEDLGQLDDAIALYAQAVDSATGGLVSPWDVAAAISNRGWLRARQARWLEAEADLGASVARWQHIGHDKLAAFIQVSLAAVARQQGQLSAAQELLNEAYKVLADGEPEMLADYHEEQGYVYRDQARWEEARTHYHEALRLHQSCDQCKSAARNLTDLAALAVIQGRWEEAAGHTAAAHEFWRQLADMDHYRPSEAARQADKDNASGLHLFCTPGDDRSDRVGEACALFRSAAKRVPDNVWYQVNLAYACAELEEWEAAGQAIQTSIEHAPAMLRVPELYDRLVEYRLKQNEAEFAAGEYEAAAEVCATSLARLEGRVPLEDLLQFWLRWGDSLLKRERFDEAQARYQNGLAHAVAVDNVVMQVGFYGRLALLAASRMRLSEALTHVRIGLGIWTQANRPAIIWDFIRDSFELVDSLPQYHALSGTLRTIAGDPSLDVAQRRDLLSIRLELSRRKYRHLFLPRESTATADSLVAIPELRPILEADASLFPQQEQTPQVLRMIETDIPAMRERIQASMGVSVPGVLIRAGQDTGRGDYVLLLHETPLADGYVSVDEKYCPDGAACRGLGITGRRSINPHDGEEGLWLPAASWHDVEAAGLPLWDAYDYMIFHLESLLHDHLASFLGVQEVHDTLDRWSEAADDRQALIAAALPDDTALARLAQVLQRLVREGVPITNLGALLDDFAATNRTGAEVDDVVESARMAVHRELTEHLGNRRLSDLSLEVEAAIARWVWERGGKRFLAIPPHELPGLLDSVRERVTADEVARHAAVVIQQPGLRPFVQRLLERYYPGLAVVAAHEIASERLSPPRGSPATAAHPVQASNVRLLEETR